MMHIWLRTRVKMIMFRSPVTPFTPSNSLIMVTPPVTSLYLPITQPSHVHTSCLMTHWRET